MIDPPYLYRLASIVLILGLALLHNYEVLHLRAVDGVLIFWIGHAADVANQRFQLSVSATDLPFYDDRHEADRS